MQINEMFYCNENRGSILDLIVGRCSVFPAVLDKQRSSTAVPTTATNIF